MTLFIAQFDLHTIGLEAPTVHESEDDLLLYLSQRLAQPPSDGRGENAPPLFPQLPGESPQDHARAFLRSQETWDHRNPCLRLPCSWIYDEDFFHYYTAAFTPKA